jgi:guanylate kinase
LENNIAVLICTDYSDEAAVSLWTRSIVSLSERQIIHGVSDSPLIIVRESGAVFWVKQKRVIVAKSPDQNISALIEVARPRARRNLSIAIGGQSAAGKTSLVQALLGTSGLRIVPIIPYTTRQRRHGEVHGRDYHFVGEPDVAEYQANPKFGAFTSAREKYYWLDLGSIFLSKWRDTDVVHTWTITQRDEYAYLRQLFPDLRWIWLEADRQTLYERLVARDDGHLEESLKHNDLISNQDIEGLVSIKFWNADVDLSFVVNNVTDYLIYLRRETDNERCNRDRVQ